MHGLICFGVLPGSLGSCLLQAQAFRGTQAEEIAITTRLHLLLQKRFSRVGNFLAEGSKETTTLQKVFKTSQPCPSELSVTNWLSQLCGPQVFALKCLQRLP